MKRAVKRRILAALTGSIVSVMGIAAVGAADMCGVKSETGSDVSGGSIVLENATTQDRIFGGLTTAPGSKGQGVATQNSVTITGSKVENLDGRRPVVAGGYGDAGALHNVVHISQSDITPDIFGGMAYTGEGTGNEVVIQASRVGGVTGGLGDTVQDNRIQIADSQVSSSVFGGMAERDQAVRNEVVVENSTVEKSVYGGYVEEGQEQIGTVANNTVSIVNSQVYDDVLGGRNNTYGTVTGNQVHVDSSTIDGDVVGGSAFYGTVSGNVARIHNSSVFFAQGGYSRLGLAVDNHLFISQSDIIGSAYGGRSYDGEVRHNDVTIQASTAWEVIGGFAAAAYGNRAWVIDSTVQKVYGGHAASGATSGNLVHIQNSTVTEVVYGGLAWVESVPVEQNTVILEGRKTDVSQAEVYGGAHEFVVCSEIVLRPVAGGNNSLTVTGWQGDVRRLAGFDRLYIEDVNLSDRPIQITAGKNGDLAQTTITTGNLYTDGGTNIQRGDSFALLTSTNDADLGFQSSHFTNAGGVSIGASGEGTGKVVVNDGKLAYEITDVQASRQANAVAAQQAAGLAFVKRGSDLASLTLHGMHENGLTGLQTFGTSEGSRTELDAGYKPTVRGWNTLVGIGNHRGQTTWSLFYENGTGRYDTLGQYQDSFFSGSGRLHYQGGGAAVRHDLTESTYIEAGVAAGTLKNDVTNGLRDRDRFYDYQTDSSYWRAFAGMGKTYYRDDGIAVGLYGKFIHTSLGGDQFTAAGDTFRLDDLDSNRLKAGVRVTMPKQEAWTAYWGLAYEYEFSGDANGRAGNYDLRTTSLQGGSVLAELGLSYAVSDSPWRADLGLAASAGTEKGWSGRLNITYGF